MSMAISPKRGTTLLSGLPDDAVFAVYADGRRLQLGPARLFAFKRVVGTWVQWGGVKVAQSGTIVAVELGPTTVRTAPRKVRVGMTFSASLPLSDLMEARDAVD